MDITVVNKVIALGERLVNHRDTYEMVANKAAEKGRMDDLAIVRREMNNKVNQPAKHNADQYWGAIAKIVLVK